MEIGMEKQTVGYVIKCVQYTLRQNLDESLGAIGLTAPQYSAMRELEREPGSSNAELARAGFVTPQTMIKILQVLQKAGYIRREAHPRHGRIQTTALTSEGRQLMAEANRRVETIETRMAAGLTAEERQTLKGLLSRCFTNLTGDELP
jgi:DNA-binding MarR family transcriptional regulator